MIYIASNVASRQRLKPIRQAIRDFGLSCSSSWLDIATDYPGDFASRPETEEWAQERHRDLREIATSSLVIIDTLEQSVTGGREFEIGYAYALGKSFWRVGPKRHLFHTAAANVFENWQHCLEVLLTDGAASLKRARA